MLLQLKAVRPERMVQNDKMDRAPVVDGITSNRAAAIRDELS